MIAGTYTDQQGIVWHADKNGRQIRGGKRLIGDDGEEYEIFGTGMHMPGSGNGALFWNSQDKAVWRDTQTMTVASSRPSAEALLGMAAIIAFVVIFLLF